MSNETSVNILQDRPYPHRCAACGQTTVNAVQIPYDARVRHDGKLHTFHIPSLRIDQCDHCGEQYFIAETDEQISVGLCRHLGMQTVDEIRAGIKKCGVSQNMFAEHLGIAAETVSRWLDDGVTQTRSLDKLMRLYFTMPSVRSALADCRGIPAVEELNASNVLEDAGVRE